MLWLWHFPYSVGLQPVSNLHIYTFVVSRAFMAGAASQTGDVDSSRAPGLTSGLQRSVNVHRGSLLLVPQWQCISSFVFYIVAAFRGMHVSPAKHSYTWLPWNHDNRTERRTDRRQTDAGQSYPYVPLCFAGDTKSSQSQWKSNYICNSSYGSLLQIFIQICEKFGKHILNKGN